MDRAIGRDGTLNLLDRTIRHSRTQTWEGHRTLTLPDDPPDFDTFDALCRIAQLIEEIHLANDPYAGRHYATSLITYCAQDDLVAIKKYLANHAGLVQRIARARRRRSRLAGGLRAGAARELTRLLTRAHLRRREKLADIPF